MHFAYWVFFFFVLLDAYSYIERIPPVESLDCAGGILDFRIWKSGFRTLPFDHEIDRIKVGLSLTPSGDFYEGASFELLDVTVHARNAHGDIFGEAVLARKA